MYLTRLPYAFHFCLSFHFTRSTYDTAFLINAFSSFRHFYPEKGLMLCPYFIFVSRVDLSLDMCTTGPLFRLLPDSSRT